MKSLVEYARTFVISIEFIVIILATICIIAQPGWISDLHAQLAIGDGILKFLALLPMSLFAYDMKVKRKIFFPENDKNRHLVTWAEFDSLRIICNVGIAYGLLFAILAVCAVITGTDAFKHHGLILLSMSILGAGTVSYSMHEAEIQINLLIEKAKKNET